MLIHYNPEQILKSASDCTVLSGEIKFQGNEIGAEVTNYSHGKVREQVNLIVEKTDRYAEKCSLLVSKTAQFLSNMAIYLETLDKEIAQKMEE